MNREKLKELGLNDEQIEAVMKAYGSSVNEIKEKANRVDGLESQITGLNEQIKDRDRQLKDLGKKAEGNEDMQKQIKELQKANEDAQKEYKANLSKQKKESKLELALKDAKARNPKAVKALIDAEKVSLDGDNLIGLNEQLEGLKESDPYLFGEDEPKGIKGRQPHISGGEPKGVTRDDINKMSYKERVQFKQENPEEYDKIIKGE